MRSYRFFAIVASAVASLQFTTALPAQDKTGTKEAAKPQSLVFDILEGTLPGGHGAYKGTLDIKPRNDVVDLEWIVSGGNKYTGIGLYEPKRFLAGAYNEEGGAVGVSVYKINGGTLDGRWADSGDKRGKTGVEVLEGPASLEGEYKITKGILPDGKSTYSGVVKIEKNGKTRRLTWKLAGGASYEGIGVGDDVFLVVGWNMTGKAGVVVYPKMNGDEMSGIWSAGSSGELGSERLRYKSGRIEPAEAPKGNDGLAKAISADLKLCADLAKKYMDAIVASDFATAASLICEKGRKGRNEKEIAAQIEQEIKIVGGVKSYVPDKSGTDFGVKEGIMTFSLACQSETGKGKRKIILRFIKQDQGIGLLGTN